MTLVGAVLGQGFGEALRASTVLRNASLYIGLLFVGLAGAGVLAELGVLSWADDFTSSSPATLDIAHAAVERAQILLVVGILGCEIALVDGTAIGMTLLASRMLGAPATLRTAIARARQVFWRLIGVGLVLALLQFLASAAYRIALGDAPATDDGGLALFTIDPVPGTLITIPFILATTSVVLADDSVVGALRRSVRMARRSKLVAIALAVFSLILSFIALFSLGSGFDILSRLVDAIHLDVTAGTPSFILAAVLGLAIVSALGSILFTAGAVVSGAQVATALRFGVPLAGLGRVMDLPGPDPAADAARMVEAADGDRAIDVGAVAASPAAADSDDAGPAAAQSVALSTDGAAEEAPALEPTDEASAPQPAPPVTYWVTPGAQADDRTKLPRRVTWPMRALSAGLWIVAVSSVLIGPPH